MNTSLSMSRLIKLALPLALLSPLLAQAHGYIDSPKSRARMCQTGANTDCGEIQYEPQSVEGPKGFPAVGPLDGTIAAGGVDRFSELNVQSPTRWQTVPLKTDKNFFTWNFTALHATTDWRYYITKPGWDSSQPLSRDSFELQPFCFVEGNSKPPSSKRVTHTCRIPSDRSGYHVILATWNIADTGNAFYQVIDADIQPAATALKKGQSGAGANAERVMANPFGATHR
ncbi:lytic polysaccharide monooxygenase [Paraherbaspirillum soli]|uniref:Lytic polysaccharide monooxygenase n=1 Tax=Paraherbaspirillum soli TaxID=631222 RepID=A0ABW0M750_9BURK